MTRKRTRRWISGAGSLLLLGLMVFSCTSSPDSRPGWIARSGRAALSEIISVGPEEVADHLQVPSPDWRDQVIYFIMTDRFDDGNPSNSDQGMGEYDPRFNSHYSGGDLEGILNNLDYIKGLGATAVWVTPPVANQWYDHAVNYGGYHGYWAENFMELDRHKGSLDDYRLLSATLHRNGMYLIQDIVTNHTGNFFSYSSTPSRSRPWENYIPNGNYVPRSAPRQFPFNLNDPREERDREIAAYHWTGPISNYNVKNQLLNNQLSDLDDINTENELVRQVLRESYAHWIREAGVDGFRVDTVKFVPVEFFHDFSYSDDPQAPGILRVATELGKDDFVSFGEAWIGSEPFNDEADRQMAEYLGSEEAPALSSLLHFSLNQDIRSVFAAGASTDRLHYRMEAAERIYPDPNLLYTFIDNHDMDRFLAIGSKETMYQSLLYLFTAPGIPVVYYGTEQHFTETRQAMFANGFGSGGRDWFDGGSPGYRLISALSSLRSAHDEFRYGSYVPLGSNAAGAGLLAYAMEYGDERSIIIMNTADYPYLVTDLDTGTGGARALEPLFTLGEFTDPLQTDSEGLLDLILPARSALVLKAGPVIENSAEAGGRPDISIDLAGLSRPLEGNTRISGSAGIQGELQLVIDGNLSSLYELEYRDGSFSGVLPAENYANGRHSLAVIGRDAEGRLVSSERVDFEIQLAFRVLVRAGDPVGDDRGPEGHYVYPLHESFSSQMDMEELIVSRAGQNLKLEIRSPGPISTVWNPVNGFDHVYYYVYLDDPARTGATQLPFQNASAPEGFDWDVMMMVGGWNASLYSAEGAGADSYGTALSNPVSIQVDEENRILGFIIEAGALGYPASLDGYGIYITTWDYDGLESANRLLQENAGEYIFGGGNFETDPLIMDDLGPVYLE